MVTQISLNFIYPKNTSPSKGGCQSVFVSTLYLSLFFRGNNETTKAYKAKQKKHKARPRLFMVGKMHTCLALRSLLSKPVDATLFRVYGTSVSQSK